MYDLVDFTRHYLTMELDELLLKSLNAIKEGEENRANEIQGKIKQLSGDLDELISLQPENSLDHWITEAYNFGDSKETGNYYINNAKTQITVWGGGHLKDYASKSWSGMYSNYYFPRWKIFLQEYNDTQKSKTDFNEKAVREKIRQWEYQWINQIYQNPGYNFKNPLKRIEKIIRLYR